MHLFFKEKTPIWAVELKKLAEKNIWHLWLHAPGFWHLLDCVFNS